MTNPTITTTTDRFTPCCNYGFATGDTGPIFWDPSDNAVRCHNCGETFGGNKELQDAAYSVIAWFDYHRPELKGPRIERLRAALPPVDWRDAISVIQVEVKL